MLRPALVFTLLGTLGLGLAYPLALTALGAALPMLAPTGGGPVRNAQGQVVGLAVVGQSFEKATYLWGRPSVTGGRAYESQLGGASNLGPSNPALGDAVATRAFALRAADRAQGLAPGAWLALLGPTEAWPKGPQALGPSCLADPLATAAWPPEPVDLVTASGSGLDPHLSPAGALRQAPRIAKARGLDPKAVATLFRGLVEPPFLGLFGAARISVLKANLALDARFGQAPRSSQRKGG